MNILVTGGAGYIGSHTCKLLRSQGHNPITFDNLSRGHKELVKWGELVVGDLHDTQLLVQTFERFKIEAVIHFAAFAYVGESMEKPDMYYHNNLEGTLSLFKAMIQAKVKNIIFSSTCATYGIPKILPITEETLQSPINPYGMTKYMVEQTLKDLAHTAEIRSVCLRYFNAAGDDVDGETGEWHEPETHLIPLVLRAAFNDQPVKIFGTDYATPDGTCIRDYIHVSDLAQAHILALEYLKISKDNFHFFNLGTQTGNSVLDIIEKTEIILNKKIKREVFPRRPGDPPILVASNEKAKKILKWDPKLSNIEIILKTAIDWHSKRKE